MTTETMTDAEKAITAFALDQYLKHAGKEIAHDEAYIEEKDADPIDKYWQLSRDMCVQSLARQKAEFRAAFIARCKLTGYPIHRMSEELIESNLSQYMP